MASWWNSAPGGAATDLNDADRIPVEQGGVGKTTTLTLLKAKFKAYFDTLYVAASAALGLGELSTNAYRGDLGKTAFDHSQLITGNPHAVTAANVGAPALSLITAVSDFFVGSAAGTVVKKTLAEVKTILGLGTAAYTASTDYAPALGADDNYVTDAEKTVIGNTSGTNTGDSSGHSALAPIQSPTLLGQRDARVDFTPTNGQTINIDYAVYSSVYFNVSALTSGQGFTWTITNRPTGANTAALWVDILTGANATLTINWPTGIVAPTYTASKLHTFCAKTRPENDTDWHFPSTVGVS